MKQIGTYDATYSFKYELNKYTHERLFREKIYQFQLMNTHMHGVFYQTKISLSKDNLKTKGDPISTAPCFPTQPIGDAKFRNKGNYFQKMFYFMAIWSLRTFNMCKPIGFISVRLFWASVYCGLVKLKKKNCQLLSLDINTPYSKMAAILVLFCFLAN